VADHRANAVKSVFKIKIPERFPVMEGNHSGVLYYRFILFLFSL
jgi:hypothetical protein